MDFVLKRAGLVPTPEVHEKYTSSRDCDAFAGRLIFSCGIFDFSLRGEKDLVLCFGTYAAVLKWACRFSNDRALVSTVVASIDPANRYSEDTSSSPVSRLLNCHDNFPNVLVNASLGPIRATEGSLTNVVRLAGSKQASDLDFGPVIAQMREDRKKAAVAALQKIIQSDTSLTGEHKATFEKCMGATAGEISGKKEIVLSLFLSGLFLYTVLTNENQNDRKDLKKIKAKGYLDEFLCADIAFVEAASFASSATDVDADSVSTYLSEIDAKYNKLKTLLYYEEPHPFYDFFVCNTIVRSQLLQGDTHYYPTQIKNATPQKLTEHNPYVIIAAYGGMGKSMMMRHFLLTAIKDYDAYRKIPVFVQLKDYKGGPSHSDLLSFIYNSSVHLMKAFTKETFEQMLSAGHILVLLDGLDELSSNYQNNFEIALERFMDLYPMNQYIMSSRPFTDFVSFERFTTLRISAFSNEQALELIDKLEFRPDDTSIKQKFINALNNGLFESHHSFVSNPLLLTIMMMTFDQIAEVSPRMHIFYRDAYTVLAQRHDASKGAYKRQLNTKLSSDQFADFFAEFCARSYTHEDYEMPEEKAKKYFNDLTERKKHPEMTATAQDFLDDLCNNICLMFKEGGNYLFTHRNFQEYFCAVFFSKQKDKDLERIGDFFERSRGRMFANQTFEMLYAMIPEKIEEYILIPYLDRIIGYCEENEGYWTYLEMMYPQMFYSEENGVCTMDAQDPKSFIGTFISKLLDISWHRGVTQRLPLYKEFLTNKLVVLEDTNGEMVDVDEVNQVYIDEYGMPDIIATSYMFDITAVRGRSDLFSEMIEILERDDFPVREEYEALKKYREDLHSRYDSETEDLFDFL